MIFLTDLPLSGTADDLGIIFSKNYWKQLLVCQHNFSIAAVLCIIGPLLTVDFMNMRDNFILCVFSCFIYLSYTSLHVHFL